MSFSYTLFLALLLISPGLAVWAGLRVGERSGLLSQPPEKPQSTFSLVVIVFGSLLGHILLALLFAVQAAFCALSHACMTIAFDPNIYREIVLGGRTAGVPSDLALFFWLMALLVPSLLMGAIAFFLSQWRPVRDFRETSNMGWLKPLADIARSRGFILGYVVTALEKDGAYVAYEGIVENIALDDQRAVAMIVLSNCDRFLVRIDDGGFARIDPKTKQKSIPLIQLQAANFKNIALEVFDVEKLMADTDSEDAPSL